MSEFDDDLRMVKATNRLIEEVSFSRPKFDETACNLFKGGADCPVRSDPGWFEIYSKNY